MMRVFVTDVQRRKAVPIIRTLGKKGVAVTGGEVSRLAMGAFSKYCKRFVAYPSPTETPELFIDFLLNYLRQHPHDVIFPLDDVPLFLCVQHKEALSKYVHVPAPNLETTLIALDKAETLKFAMENGIPCPRTYFIKDLQKLRFLSEIIPYPAVIKPRLSSGSRGIAYVRKKEDFISTYEQVHKNYPYPIVQEWIPVGGDAFGVSVLFDQKTELKAVFVHKRLREYPVSGGPSTLRISVENYELQEMAVHLLKALKWYGVAMVEFKVDPRDSVPKLMEINPRFWGSVQLAIVAGVDFPFFLYQIATGQQIEPVLKYKLGVKCRWLIPGDVLHFLSNPNRFQLKPSFFQFWGTYYDILSLDDMGPLFGFCFASLKSIFSSRDLKSILKR